MEYLKPLPLIRKAAAILPENMARALPRKRMAGQVAGNQERSAGVIIEAEGEAV